MINQNLLHPFFYGMKKEKKKFMCGLIDPMPHNKNE